jgi:hypothetical protein
MRCSHRRRVGWANSPATPNLLGFLNAMADHPHPETVPEAPPVAKNLTIDAIVAAVLVVIGVW